MEAAREELRRVVPLAAVTKITQLSPDALTRAANRALAAVLKLAPPTELGALDGCAPPLPAAVYIWQGLRSVHGCPPPLIANELCTSKLPHVQREQPRKPRQAQPVPLTPEPC